MDAWSEMGWTARLALLVCFVPVVAAATYAVRPTPRRLAITKALSIATLCAGCGATLFGITALLRNIGHHQQLGHDDWPWIAIGFSERLVTSSAALAAVAIAWLLVALGTGRTPGHSS